MGRAGDEELGDLEHGTSWSMVIEYGGETDRD